MAQREWFDECAGGGGWGGSDPEQDSHRDAGAEEQKLNVNINSGLSL